MAYRTHVLADIPLGFSGLQSDHLHSVALQGDRSSPHHTLVRESERGSAMFIQSYSLCEMITVLAL